MTKADRNKTYKTIVDQMSTIERLNKAISKVCVYLEQLNQTNDCVANCPLKFKCHADVGEKLPCQDRNVWKEWILGNEDNY